MSKKKNLQPKLFDITPPPTKRKEDKSRDFIQKLTEEKFIDNNPVFLSNYISGSKGNPVSVAYSHIKENYKKYVENGVWTEKKFKTVVYSIVDANKVLSSWSFLHYGAEYDKKYNKEKKKTHREELEEKIKKGEIKW